MFLEDKWSRRTADWCKRPVWPHALITMRRSRGSILLLRLHPLSAIISAFRCDPPPCPQCHLYLSLPLSSQVSPPHSPRSILPLHSSHWDICRLAGLFPRVVLEEQPLACLRGMNLKIKTLAKLSLFNIMRGILYFYDFEGGGSKGHIRNPIHSRTLHYYCVNVKKLKIPWQGDIVYDYGALLSFSVCDVNLLKETSHCICYVISLSLSFRHESYPTAALFFKRNWT